MPLEEGIIGDRIANNGHVPTRARSRGVGLVLLAALLTMTTVLGAAAASADVAGDRCASRIAPNFGVTMTLPGTTRPQIVPIVGLQTGDRIRVTATGSIATGGWSGSHDAGGAPEPAPAGVQPWPWPYLSWPAPGHNKYAIYGSWGHDGNKFRVGADSGCVRYERRGNGPDQISLGINDENLDDNTGTFQVRVEVWRNPSLLRDGGFEDHTSRTVSSPWVTEGPDAIGIDIGQGLAHADLNNAFLRAASNSWNALKQRVTVIPYTNYRLQGWVRTSNNFNAGFFGVRPGDGNSPLAEIRYGSFTPAGYEQLTVDFNSGPNTAVTSFVGYWAPGYDSWVQVDDMTLRSI
jgi:hypothetical protein